MCVCSGLEGVTGQLLPFIGVVKSDISLARLAGSNVAAHGVLG